MKKNTILIIVLLIAFNASWSQVGINTDNPTETLDVVGDTYVSTRLYLENPGNRTQSRGARFLVLSSIGVMKEYDINTSKYGPINVAQFILRNASSSGVKELDTKIPVADYVVSVQGVYFLDTNGGTNVMLNSNSSDNNVEGYRFQAVEVNGTWVLKAEPNNAKFRVLNSSWEFVESEVDIYLSVVIYRKRFMTKSLDPVVVEMNGSTTGTAPLPTGF